SLASAARMPSPSSAGLLSQPSLSFAVSKVLGTISAPLRSRSAPTKSYPGNSLPARSGWSARIPVSSTATTTGAAEAAGTSQADWALIADSAAELGGFRYHCPTTGPPVKLAVLGVPPDAY